MRGFLQWHAYPAHSNMTGGSYLKRESQRAAWWSDWESADQLMPTSLQAVRSGSSSVSHQGLTSNHQITFQKLIHFRSKKK